MKKIFILSLLIGWGYTLSAQTSDYMTYQLAFRKGNKVMTLQPDLNSVKAVSTTTQGGNNDLSQHFIFHRKSDQGFLIASAAAPDKFLKRVGSEVVLTTFDEHNTSDYLWLIHIVKVDAISTSEGGKLTALLIEPNGHVDPNTQLVTQALALQADGTLKMSVVDYGVTNDPHRLYVLRKVKPGKF